MRPGRSGRDAAARGVVVSGVGVLSSIGCGKQAFLEGLRRGSSGIRPIRTFDVSTHRSPLGGEIRDFTPERVGTPKELRRMDRASQLVLAAAGEAVADASLDPADLDPLGCGAVIGTTLGGMLSGERYHRGLISSGRRKASLLLDSPAHAAADRLCVRYGFRGPSYTVSTACASGSHAVGFASDLVRGGEADIVLAGGVDTMAQLTQSGFGILRLLIGKEGRIQPFDRNRAGFALGEGAAVLVLEEREHARRRNAPIRAEIRGYGLCSDAHHMTAPDPSGSGAARAMLMALDDAGIAAHQVEYVNAHGTATRHNDRMETRAIRKVFGDHADHLPVSSTKSMIGHTLGAAGAIELVGTILAMGAGVIPPTINFEEADPECDLDYVPNVARPAKVGVALSNSFGFGGANCSIVVST